MNTIRDLLYSASYPFPIILPVVMPSIRLFKRARDIQTNMNTNEIRIGAGSCRSPKSTKPINPANAAIDKA